MKEAFNLDTNEIRLFLAEEEKGLMPQPNRSVQSERTTNPARKTRRVDVHPIQSRNPARDVRTQGIGASVEPRWLPLHRCNRPVQCAKTKHTPHGSKNNFLTDFVDSIIVGRIHRRQKNPSTEEFF